VKLAAFAVVYTTLATLGLVVLRRTLADASLDEVVRSPWLYVGGAFYAASFATFLLSLRSFEVLTVFPLFTGITYASVAVAAALVLDEQLTAARFAGMAFVAVGAVLLVR
jgi:multidrug transporter EmrE-like cation transporter